MSYSALDKLTSILWSMAAIILLSQMRILCTRTFGFSQRFSRGVNFTSHFIYVWTSKPASKSFRSPSVITTVPTNQVVLARSPELFPVQHCMNCFGAGVSTEPFGLSQQHYLSVACHIRHSSPVLILHNFSAWKLPTETNHLGIDALCCRSTAKGPSCLLCIMWHELWLLLGS